MAEMPTRTGCPHYRAGANVAGFIRANVYFDHLNQSIEVFVDLCADCWNVCRVDVSARPLGDDRRHRGVAGATGTSSTTRALAESAGAGVAWPASTPRSKDGSGESEPEIPFERRADRSRQSPSRRRSSTSEQRLVKPQTHRASDSREVRSVDASRVGSTPAAVSPAYTDFAFVPRRFL